MPSRDNVIHPTAVIGPGVELGGGNTIGPYAVVLGGAVLGSGNWIGPHVSIGTPAQMRGGVHGAGWVTPAAGGGVRIGDNNVIREYVTIHLPTEASTTVGDDCFLMAYAHVPHDATVHDGVTMANSAQVGGHTVIGKDATIGLSVTVHQRLWIGAGSMIGMGATVTRDVPPFAVATGSPARVTGPNVVRLHRTGLSEELVQAVANRLSGDVDGVALPAELEAAFVEYEERRGARA